MKKKHPQFRAKEGKQSEDLCEVCVIKDLVRRTRSEKRDSGSAKAGKVHSLVEKDNGKRKLKSDDEAKLDENEF